jgi:hypothetical protein
MQMGQRSALAFSVLLLMPIAIIAQNSMIRGKVRGSGGAIVNNATVELRGSNGAVIGQAFTRNDGDFSFSRLAAGEYEVYVTMSGYEPSLQRVELRDSMRLSPGADVVSEMVNIEVVLRPRAEPPLAAPGISFAQDVPKAALEAYTKGISRIQEGKSEEGIAFLRQAIAEFSDYFDAHQALGLEFYRLGRDNDALQALERARLINDKGFLVYYTFGLLMARQQKFGAAEYAFRQAAELNDRHVNAHFNHAVALIEVALRSTNPTEVKKCLASADQELDRAWDLSDRKLNTVFLQRARVHEERRNNEAAARELESYLRAERDAKDAAAVKQAIAKLRAKK